MISSSSSSTAVRPISRAGWRIERLDAEMTRHDAALMRFGQWWTRARRAGHAFAEGAALHGAGPERHWVAETRRALLWGAALPAGVVAGAMLSFRHVEGPLEHRCDLRLTPVPDGAGGIGGVHLLLAPPAAPSAAAAEPEDQGLRILVVEDDIRNVYALTGVFEPHGATVQIARNGREALEALGRINDGAAPKIDLVLMDVMMPEMDGLTATREIRKIDRWKGLPIIMLTAKAMAEDQNQCLAAGANDYLPKPLDVDKLLSLTRVWMPR